MASGSPYSFKPSASDPDGQTLKFSITGLPAWATFDAATGALTGTPAQAGTYSNIVISVSDGLASASLAAFSITVTATSTPPTNTPPTITGAPPSKATVGQLYSFTPSASDKEAQKLTFSIASKPAWAQFDTATGRLYGTPATANVGTFSNIVISVSDGQASSSLAAFSITVATPPNTAPRISGSPATSVASGSPYSFKPSASDPDGQTLKFSITGLPAWAIFDTATGALTGTPTAAQAGTYSNIVISVSDGLASASLAAFSITVTATNTPPTISGSAPTTATVGQLYSFTPTASDKEGQKLTFSITSKPAWAQFDTATGRLYGTPAAANVGTFSNIVISVSDGQASSSLGAFSLTVKSGTLGSATLSWAPPTQNVDGTPVTNLGGYRIAYGQSSTNLSLSLNVASPSITSATIESLTSGTWYFAVKAYTTTGVESDLSNLAQKTVY